MVAIFWRRKERNLQAHVEHRHDQVYPLPVFLQPDTGYSPQISHHNSYDAVHRKPVVSPGVYPTNSRAYELDVREAGTQEQNTGQVAPTAIEETRGYHSGSSAWR